MKIKTLLTIMVLAIAMSSFAAPLSKPTHKIDRLICPNDTLWVYSPEITYSVPIKISTMNTSERFNFGALDKPYSFGITNGIDSFEYEHQKLPRVHIDVSNGKRSVDVFLFAYMNPQAKFDEDHKREFDNQVVVEIPEAYEMVNILLSLTTYCRQDSDLLDMQKPYFHEVQQTFAQWENSPLVVALNKALEQDKEAYISFRNSGFAYHFEFDKLVESKDYRNFNSRLGINDFKLQLEDFAQRSGFRKFYAKHKLYYKSLIDAHQQWVNVKEMKTWLENRFSNRFNAYRVILSPLVSNKHTINTFSDSDFKEAVLFINAFDPSATRSESTLQTRYRLWSIAFTEMSRLYLDPVSDRHINEVNTTFNNSTYWKSPNGSNENKANSIFNEYMKLGLLTLYMNDHMSSADFTAIYETHKTTAENKLGFQRFGLFSDELLKLHRNGEKDIDKLYTYMLEWMAKNN